MSIENLQIVIDVRVDGNQISGRVGDGAAPPEAFQGWLGLLRALDGLLTATDEEPVALR